MPSDQDERLAAELALLQAMYPEQLKYDEKRREISFAIAPSQSSLALRLPHDYLVSGLPEVISATSRKHDLHDPLRAQIQECSRGEEILDSVLLAYQELVDQMNANANLDLRSQVNTLPSGGFDTNSKATVIVWLHHLLNTNKRKQALSPPGDSVAGISKPGYPGVLVFSGPADEVHEHVDTLKQLNWQAFQIRLDAEELWTFRHGLGVIEVESMGGVVAEIGEARKQLFMEVMRMK